MPGSIFLLSKQNVAFFFLFSVHFCRGVRSSMFGKLDEQSRVGESPIKLTQG